MRKHTLIAAMGLLAAGCGPEAENVAATEPETFTDCEGCPVMVIVPGGEFTMGSPTSELFRGAEPQHQVTIPEFALGKYEITFDQWEACLAGGGCGGYMPDDIGWGRGNRPAINLSFEDANAYITWLSEQTGKAYRLPSESEWEYAARAGSTTTFAFGETISSEQANYDGTTGYNGGPTGPYREMTMPVGSFPPNAFGLHDMHGNVWEWVQDCWSDQYFEETPADGKPYLGANCDGRVMRGGSWEDYSGEIRAAARVGNGINDLSWSDGFRVALSLE